MTSRLSFIAQPGQPRQPRAESANINRRTTVMQPHVHPQTNARGDAVRQSAWAYGPRGKERPDQQNQTVAMQLDLQDFFRSKGKVLKSSQWSSINDYVECFLFLHDIAGLKLIAKNHLATFQNFNVNQVPSSNQQGKQNMAIIRSNVIQLIGAIWSILMNPPYDTVSAQLKTFLHSYAVNKASNPFEKQVDVLKGINSDLAAVQAALDSGSRKALSPKLVASLTKDTWKMLLLVQYLEYVKKSYHSFISERIHIRKRVTSNANAAFDWDEIIADLTPEQKKALQDVEGLYPISNGGQNTSSSGVEKDLSEQTVVLGAKEDGTFDDEMVKSMIDYAFQMFPDRNLVTTPPYSGMILSLYTRTSPCAANETLDAFQQKVNDCRVTYMDRLDAITHENVHLKSQLQSSLEAFCSNMSELLVFICRSSTSDSNLNAQIFNLLKKAKLVTTEDIIKIEKTDPAVRDAAIVDLFHHLQISSQYLELALQSIVARSQDFYTMYNACTDIIDAFISLLSQKAETLESTLNLLNHQNKKEMFLQKISGFNKQKSSLKSQLNELSEQIARIQEQKIMNADNYVSHHVYTLNMNQFETTDKNNKNKTAQIMELQEKILESKKMLSESANGLANELSALQDKISESPTLARFMETTGVYSPEKAQGFESAFLSFSDVGINDITLPLDRGGTTNAIEQMCSTLGPVQDGEPRRFKDLCSGLKMMCEKLIHLFNLARKDIEVKQQRTRVEETSLRTKVDLLTTENRQWKERCDLAALRYTNFKVERDYAQEASNAQAVSILKEIHDLSKKKVDLNLQIQSLDQEIADLKKRKENTAREVELTRAECNEKLRSTVFSCNNLLAMVESFRMRTMNTLTHVAMSLQQTGERVDEAELRIGSILELVNEMRNMAASVTEKHRK